MDTNSLVGDVASRAGFESEDEGRELLAVTLEAVADHLGPAGVGELQAALPDDLAPHLAGSGGDPLSTDEFVARVAARTGVGSSTAPHHVAAVFAAVRDGLGENVVASVLTELPKDFKIMLDAEPAWTGSGA